MNLLDGEFTLTLERLFVPVQRSPNALTAVATVSSFSAWSVVRLIFCLTNCSCSPSSALAPIAITPFGESCAPTPNGVFRSCCHVVWFELPDVGCLRVDAGLRSEHQPRWSPTGSLVPRSAAGWRSRRVRQSRHYSCVELRKSPCRGRLRLRLGSGSCRYR